MKRYIIYFLLFLVYSSSSNAQMFDWVKGGGTNEDLSSWVFDESIQYMCTDHNGNVYALGVVGRNAPLTADTFFRASGAYGVPQNIFISSYDCDGNMRWAKLIGSSSGQCYPYGISCDTSGHVYVSGLVSNGNLYIGYDTTVTGSLYQCQAVMQFDTVGQFNWIRYIGDNTFATLYGANGYGSSVAVDGDDNVHFFCQMKSGVPITPTLTSIWGIYDVEYSPSGVLLDVKRMLLADTALYFDRVVIDKPTGKVYAVGKKTGPTGGYAHPFIAAFDTDRNVIWKDTLRNPTVTSSSGGSFGSIAIDEYGNLYVVG